MVSLSMNSAAQSRASALLSVQQDGKNSAASLLAGTSSSNSTRINGQSTTGTAASAGATAPASRASSQAAGQTARAASSATSAASQISLPLPGSTIGGTVIDEASSRMNRDAFLVFSMLGIPADRAREMAQELSGATNNITNPDGLNASMRNFDGQISNLSLVASSVELNFSQTNMTSFTNVGGGTSVSVTDFQMHVEQVRIEISNVIQEDPLILDLDGNGIDITSLRDGAVFDLDGDGTKDRVAWVAGNDALLALDKNKNGQIDDGTELFGDQNGAKDGFAELATYDDNADGTIDAQDKVFSSLILLHADGSQSSLADEGITSIRVSAITPLSQRLIGGTLAAQGDFVRDDGSLGKTGEVLLDMQA